MERFNAMSFVRNVLHRGAAIVRGREPKDYEGVALEINAASHDYVDVLKPHLASATSNEPFKIGDIVTKTGGDYSYTGHVVGRVVKRSGQVRWVVEDDRGLLFIFNTSQLALVEAK
jgi:hypothetical protein